MRSGGYSVPFSRYVTRRNTYNTRHERSCQWRQATCSSLDVIRLRIDGFEVTPIYDGEDAE